MIVDMTGSQHRHPNRNYRPDPAEYDPARAAVEAAGYNMNTLIRAFLRWLNEDPRRLGQLAKHLRSVADETPYGRPRKSADA
jgi:hypothetical protein